MVTPVWPVMRIKPAPVFLIPKVADCVIIADRSKSVAATPSATLKTSWLLALLSRRLIRPEMVEVRSLAFVVILEPPPSE